LKGIAGCKRIETRPGVGVDAEIGGILLPKVVQTEKQDAMLEYVCGVPRMKGMTVAEHPFRVS
jgi:hypothetical protein